MHDFLSFEKLCFSLSENVKKPLARDIGNGNNIRHDAASFGLLGWTV